jgi:hypothetical protein
MTGRTLRIYLVDGSPTGVLTAEIMNWTGRVTVGPRSQLAAMAKRPELSRTGICLLVGPDLDVPGKDRVYVGEADKAFTRLTKHEGDEAKDFWTRTVVLTSKDENLTKAHVRYLESRLLQTAAQAGRATLDNETAPPPPPLPEPDVADMEFFLEPVQLVLPVLGFTFTQPRPTADTVTAGAPRALSSPVFVMSPVGTNARAQEVDGEFVVMKGSTARKQGIAKWTNYKVLRDQLVQEGRLVEADNPSILVFSEDVAFASPSAAATVVFGGNQSGPQVWRTEDGAMTYKEWWEAKLKQAGVKLPGS